MLTPDDFINLTPVEAKNLLAEITAIPAKAPKIQIEQAVYNAAGVIGARLRLDFNLRKLSKRDIAIYLVAKGAPIEDWDDYIHPIAKYIRDYFAMSYQGPSELASLKY